MSNIIFGVIIVAILCFAAALAVGESERWRTEKKQRRLDEEWRKKKDQRNIVHGRG
jgi:hypothetical protein